MNTSFIFSSSPHLRTSRTAASCMLHVVVALIPAIVCAVWYFGLAAATVLAVSIISCCATEWFITRFMLHKPCSIGNFSALLTGLLLGLNLPASLPWWIVVIGSVFAIGVGKMAFGGLGCNIFNPALVGRVFLLISFPVAMTTWPLPGGEFAGVDGATGATILARIKMGDVDVSSLSYVDMLLGNMGGSIGEVGAIALIIGFIYLLAVRVISWHIPASIIATVAIFDLAIGAPVGANLLSGGLLLGAIFMATDYVTSPMTHRGMIIYGVLIGVITVVIRQWGVYPEGMSFAILIGNAVTPLINKYVTPQRFAERRVAK